MIIDERVQGFDSLIKRNKSSIVDKDKAAFEAAKLRKKKSIEMKQNSLHFRRGKLQCWIGIDHCRLQKWATSYFQSRGYSC